jgi:hypothetical protein
VTDQDHASDFLEHYGVKGMKWGIRKDRNYEGASRAVNREARKDAEETARAKMYFGDGAGTRRKLINRSVEAKRQKDPSYSKAFDFHLERQDASEHASGARRERARTDRRERNKKRSGAIARRVTGEMGTQAAFVALAFGGAAFVKSPRGQALIQKAMFTVKDAKDRHAHDRGAQFLKDYFERNS